MSSNDNYSYIFPKIIPKPIIKPDYSEPTIIKKQPIVEQPIIEQPQPTIIEPTIKIEKKIYSIIPLHIFQTWNTLYLPYKMIENIEKLKYNNPEFIYHLYDDNMCRDFIEKYFDYTILYTYNKKNRKI